MILSQFFHTSLYVKDAQKSCIDGQKWYCGTVLWQTSHHSLTPPVVNIAAPCNGFDYLVEAAGVVKI